MRLKNIFFRGVTFNHPARNYFNEIKPTSIKIYLDLWKFKLIQVSEKF